MERHSKTIHRKRATDFKEGENTTIKVGDKIKTGPWAGFELVSQYTSNEAVEDGLLFDIDPLLKMAQRKGAITDNFPIKYITTNLLELGYWNDRCNNAVKLEDAGTADRCQSCPTWIVFIKNGNKNNSGLPCKEKTLNLPNVLDLLTAAIRIFNKKPQDDYFVSGRIELPNGDKQTVYIAQNETGRYTLMLPEDD